MHPVIVAFLVVAVVAVVVNQIQRRARMAARKEVKERASGILLPDSASHRCEQADHAQKDAAHGNGHHATPDASGHDCGSFHDSVGHSGFDGSVSHGGHH